MSKKTLFLNSLILLLFCLLIDFTFARLAYVVYSLVTFLIFILLNIYSRWFFVLGVVLSGIIATIYLPLRLMYGDPNLGMILSAMYTNQKESFEFLGNIPKIYLMWSLFTFISMLIVTKVRVKLLPNKITHLLATLVLLFLLIASLFSMTENRKLIFLPVLSFSENLYNSYYDALNEKARLQKLLTQADDWQPTVSATKYDTYIMVIGESARKDFLHSLDFNIANTPYTDYANGTLYSQYFSAGPDTVISLTHSLTLNDTDNKAELNNNIISLANKAGFYTYWISNQGSLGVFDTPIAAIGKKAKFSYFTKTGDFNYGNISDDSMLPYVESALTEKVNNPKRIIVIHLMGSHPNFCDRTNGQYDHFFMSRNVSCYVKSIEQTDLFLQKVVTLANDSHSKWSLMYFSDHGLKLLDKNTNAATLAHSDLAIQDYHIPLFITGYDADKHLVNSNLYSARNFLDMFSNWTGISDRQIINNCNPLTKQTCKLDKATAFNDNGQLVDVLSLYDDKVQ